VERLSVHREGREEHVVCLGHGAARAVKVARADLELLEEESALLDHRAITAPLAHL
jgi:hypothetical protein